MHLDYRRLCDRTFSMKVLSVEIEVPGRASIADGIVASLVDPATRRETR